MMKIDNTRGGTTDGVDGANSAQSGNENRFNGSGARDTNAPKTSNGLEREINKGMRKYLISDKMIALLNNQLQDEMINHNLYRSFSLYYKSVGLPKMCEYFELRAKEELEHHNWIYGYLKVCGVPLQYPDIPAINEDVTDEITPVKLTVDKEIETTMYINEIVKLAMSEGDYGTLAWLNGNGYVEGKLVPEQTEEMVISNEIFRIASRNDADWIAKSDAILSYYKSTRP